MKYLKHLLTAAILFQYGIMAHAEDFSEGKIYYNILSRTELTVEVTYEGEYFETQANEYTGKVTIPATVTHNDTTYRVVQIGDDAFNECYNLTTVTLPEGITSIGNAAFRSCDALSAITIPEGVTSIGNGAFYDCGKLTAISLPNSVTSMGNGVFSSCTALKSVVLSENIKTIGMSVFLDCAKLESINLPEGLTSIGDYAFSACKKLTSITIPGSVTLIKNYAFENCTGLTSISCNANTPVKIGANTFYNINKSIPVYVPASAISAYQSAAHWSTFTNIQTVTYLVTFMINGRTVATEKFGYGEAIVAPEVSQREGYTIQWNNLPQTMPANDITINGTYVINKYQVTFMIDDEVIASESLEYGSTIVAPEAPQREGHTFNGWGEVAKTVPAKDVTYNGTYSVNSYTITYMVGDEVINTYSITYGSPIVTPENPEREGHTFSGWSSELPEVMPANDIITYATFTVNKYLVTFMIDEEVIATDSLEYGSAIIVPEAPEREGHTFNGWGEVAETVPAKDVTYNGTYSVNSYTITYMVGDEIVSTYTIAYGALIIIPENPESEGYTFEGWSEELPEYMPAKDITIHATFAANKYLVTFMIDDQVIATDSLEYGTTIITPEAPEREGYTFDGWVEVAETVPAKDVTYNGTYSVNSYTITYMVGDEIINTYTIEYGSPLVTPEDPEREGHTFSGWNSELPEVMPAKDITIYATFTVNKYQVTFMIDGEVISSESIEYGSAIVLPEAPLRDGYTFDGWGEVPETVPAKDVTYNGTYSVTTYTLTYMVDGEVLYTYSLTCDSPIIVPETPEREGYTFNGWSEELPEVMPAKDIIVYAIFTVNKYLVTFMIDEEVIAADSLEYGSAIIVPEAPEREGHTFSGWGEVAGTVPANDVTYSGTYSVNSYTITYMVGDEVINTYTIEYGSPLVTPEDPEREGHTFNGWSSELPGVMPANDITIYGSFTINKYLVTFIVDGEVIAADSLEYGSVIVAPEMPEREGYTFDGWNEVAETVPASDVTYEGHYSIKIYKVYYYVGEELVHTAEVAYGEAIPEYVYESTIEGDVFIGWIGETYETMPAHDVTYRANIENGIGQLTIHNSQLTIYDLHGRRVQNTDRLTRGIYIVNGRKVVVR